MKISYVFETADRELCLELVQAIIKRVDQLEQENVSDSRNKAIVLTSLYTVIGMMVFPDDEKIAARLIHSVVDQHNKFLHETLRAEI